MFKRLIDRIKGTPKPKSRLAIVYPIEELQKMKIALGNRTRRREYMMMKYHKTNSELIDWVWTGKNINPERENNE